MSLTFLIVVLIGIAIVGIAIGYGINCVITRHQHDEIMELHEERQIMRRAVRIIEEYE